MGEQIRNTPNQSTRQHTVGEENEAGETIGGYFSHSQNSDFLPSDSEFHNYHGYNQEYDSPNFNHRGFQSQDISFGLHSANIVHETQEDCTNFNLNI